MIQPFFARVGPTAAAISPVLPATFIAAIRPIESRILVRLAGDDDEHATVGFRDATVIATIKKSRKTAFAIARAPDQTNPARYDVIHVASGLRAWRSRSFPEAIQDAAMLTWFDAWNLWIDRPGELPTPPAVTAYLGATGGRYDLATP